MLLSKSVSIRRIAGQVDILEIDNDLAVAQISLFGGHVLSYVPKRDGQDRLWLSAKAVLDGSKAIRGGIPICWPWFGDHATDGLPAHGYVRTQTWRVAECLGSQFGTTITLQPATAIAEGLKGDAELQLSVFVGNELGLQLITTNQGDQPLVFGGALHSYFNVSDIHQTRLKGVGGEYLDKTAGYARNQTPEVYQFDCETDRIHLIAEPIAGEQPLVIDAAGQKIEIESAGQDSVVVWNPWREKSAAMSDMENDGYQSMLCVEAAVTQGMILAPQAQHILSQVIR